MKGGKKPKETRAEKKARKASEKAAKKVAKKAPASRSQTLDESELKVSKVSVPIDSDDSKGSRALRQAEDYAGAGMGSHFPAHKGTEVELNFVEGDSDRPVIIGQVPNPESDSVSEQATVKERIWKETLNQDNEIYQSTKVPGTIEKELTQTIPTMTVEHKYQTNLINRDNPIMESIPEFIETDSEFHSRTYDPTLWRRPRIMVPVDVQAMVIQEVKPNWCYDCDANLLEDHSGSVCTLVSKRNMRVCNSTNIGQCWAELGTDFSVPTPPPGLIDPEPVTSEYAIHPEPFSLKDSEVVRQPGIYLHWAMPDALMEGAPKKTHQEPEYLDKTTDLEGKISTGEEFENENAHSELKDEFKFPQLPDRWLVVRTYPGAALSSPGEPANVRAWVIESDTLEIESINLWESPGPSSASDEMTAIGPGNGDPTWTVTYDNAEGRFTFYDSGPSNPGPLNYLVTGWYSDKRADPLWKNSNYERTFWFDILKELGWYVDSADVEFRASVAEGFALNRVAMYSVRD